MPSQPRWDAALAVLRALPSPAPPGYGLPDDVVIEKCGKGDTFVDCTGADVKISSIKFVQHDAVEGILSKCPAIPRLSVPGSQGSLSFPGRYGGRRCHSRVSGRLTGGFRT